MHPCVRAAHLPSLFSMGPQRGSNQVGEHSNKRLTCVVGIRLLEEGTGAFALSWQNPILCLSMRSSCERITTPCRSKGTSATGHVSRQHRLSTSLNTHS